MRAELKILLLFVCLPTWAVCQNTIGFPEVINYTKQSYNAGLQNWDIKQDKNGLIYIANNEGLLTFDGATWNLFPLPNKTIVRSIEIGLDNRIYVGGQDELGYFAPAKNGRLQFHSLIQLLPAESKVFGDVWDIVSYNKAIFFRSANKIFRLAGDKVEVFKPPSEWSFLGECNGTLYAHDFKTGLMRYENNAWQALKIKSQVPLNEPVTAILPIGNDSALITTLKNGLFVLSASEISKLSSANNQQFESDWIYAATSINNEWIALATNSNGISIIDHRGNIIQSFSRTEELQDNNVLSIFLDNQRNLWLGLNNGIDFIAYNSAIKHITPQLLDGSGYTAIIDNDRLYAGTSNGLYSVALQPVKDLSFSKGAFTQVSGSKGQAWALAKINDQLLMGHHEGAFLIKENSAVPIASQRGFWNFNQLSSSSLVPQMVAGNYNGLMFFDDESGTFAASKKVPGFVESSRFVAVDDNDNIWVSHPYHGVYKITSKAGGTFSVSTYSHKNGLPSILNNHVYKVKNEVVVATEKGIYTYNKQKDVFEPSAFYKKILGEQSIRYLKDDMAGNIWFIHDKTLGVADMSSKTPTIIYLPELKSKMLSGFEFIYPVDESNVFLGGEKGFYHINYAKYKREVPALKVQVRTVRIGSDKDSLLFGGYFKGVNERQVQEESNAPNISYDWKMIHFEFSSTLFGYQANLEYSFRLKGFDENWSGWNKRTEKEYTNLPAGSYTFEVKVRNNLGNESPVSVYAFSISPPWYKTWWAKFLYLVLLCIGIYAAYRWQRKKFLLQQKRHEEEQQKLVYIHELERNKAEGELAALRNHTLESEINFKNSELATSAMHLVKKGELLTKVKTELSQVMKRLDNEQAISELKKMVRSLSEDENIDKEWENFIKHFDKVHSDFVVILKEKHPTITGNELKLCAYLRMNLSTKEIAQLMNISVRGVEISRYRLRKKLGISSEVSLFGYLIDLKAGS